MKKLKIYSALCGLLLSAQAVSAQQFMWLMDENGALTGMKIADVSDIYFDIDSDWLSVTNSMEAKTKNSFTAKITLSLVGEVKSINTDFQVGVCYSDETNEPTLDDLSEVVGSEIKSYDYTVSGLVTGTTYYCRSYVKIGDSVYYGDVMQVQTYGTAPQNKVVEGHKFIDLGLPSGILWAETNVGASSKTGQGAFVAWGEPSNKIEYSMAKYKYYADGAYTKYNKTDAKVRLEGSDDAASMEWGATCRMPLAAEFDELLTATDCVSTSWTQFVDETSGEAVYGLLVVSKKYNTRIFLPASGYYNGTSESETNTTGKYWSSSRTTDMDEDDAQAFVFGQDSKSVDSEARYYGFSVRAVVDK